MTRRPLRLCSATPEKREAREEKATGGKLIHEDVFLSRLAERRQAEQNYAGGEALVIDAILGALENIGLDPNTVAPDFVKMSRAASRSKETGLAPDAGSLDLESLAVEKQFLNELSDGQRPSLSDYIQRYPAQRDALQGMVARMDPRELAGLSVPDGMTPAQETAARAGQEEGTRRALREAPKRGSQRGRGAAQQMVAEERASYDASQTGGVGEAKPKRDRKRARPARPEEKGSED